MYPNSNPRVSVIIPTYNRPADLQRAVVSVLKQSYTMYELIIVDDGSSPSMKQCVESFEDIRIRYIYQNNKGLSAARNTGIRSANGEYVAFLDDDDEFLPQKLMIQVNLLDNSPLVGMVIGGFNFIDKDRKILVEARPWENNDPNDLKTWLFGCPTVPSVVMLRKSWLEKVGGFDENQRYIEDVDLWLRLVYAGCKLQFVHEILSNYTVNYSGISSQTTPMRDGTVRLLNKFFILPDLDENIKSLKNSTIATAYLTAAMKEFCSGSIDQAKNNISAALLVDSSMRSNPTLLINAVYNRAIGPYLTKNPISFVKKVFNNLPDEAKYLRRYKRKVLGMVHLSFLFQARTQENWQQVRKHAFALILCSPISILDSGVLSSIFIALFGNNNFLFFRKLLSRTKLFSVYHKKKKIRWP